jgi:exodeoxyribonuclease V alpha subunit
MFFFSKNEGKFPFLDLLLRNKVLLNIDLFFAFKFFKKNDENILLSLSFLFAASRQGHLCVSLIEGKLHPDPIFLFLENGDQISLFKEKVIDGFSRLYKEMDNFDEKGIKVINNSFYLERNFSLESKIALRFNELFYSIPKIHLCSDKINSSISKYGLSLLEKQKQAVKVGLEKGLSFIFGGPGTGKSFTVGHLVNIFSKLTNGSKIILTAPTGKAVLNLEVKVKEQLDDYSSVSLSALTLHSLLQVNQSLKKRIKIEADLIIIDEGSMIDAKIFALLLDAIIIGTRIVFVGDPYQLPPIESGNLFSVFSKLHMRTNATELSQCMRSENRVLLQVAQMIKEGKSKDLLFTLKEGGEHIFYHNEVKDFAKVLINKVEEHYFDFSYEKTDPELLLKRFSSFKILTAMNEGFYGMKYLNTFIADHLLSTKPSDAPLVYPIMITKNDYDLELYNGTLGIVIREKGRKEFEGFSYFPSPNSPLKKIPLFLLSSYELAYVLSIHKSQGSEFDHVLIILTQGSVIFGRELLYTAVTRAKKSLNILSTDKAIEGMITNKNNTQNNLIEKLSFCDCEMYTDRD